MEGVHTPTASVTRMATLIMDTRVATTDTEDTTAGMVAIEAAEAAMEVTAMAVDTAAEAMAAAIAKTRLIRFSNC